MIGNAVAISASLAATHLPFAQIFHGAARYRFALYINPLNPAEVNAIVHITAAVYATHSVALISVRGIPVTRARSSSMATWYRGPSAKPSGEHRPSGPAQPYIKKPHWPDQELTASSNYGSVLSINIGTSDGYPLASVLKAQIFRSCARIIKP